MLLMQLLSIKLNLLPVIASGVNIRSALMPMLTLAISMSAKYMRQVRAAVLEELNKDYVQGARARGIRESVILWKNVIKSAMLTIITLLALSIGSLLGGTAIIESIFMWMGRKAGSGCDHDTRLPGDSGICRMDGTDLCHSQSDHGSLIPLPGSENPSWG